jgi:hypothetical protein
MEQALLVNDSETNEIYAIATEKDGSIRIFGATEAAQEWAEWVDSRLQGRGKLADVIPFLDTPFAVDGPKPLTRPIRAQIAQQISKFSQQTQNELLVGRSGTGEEKSAFKAFSSIPSTSNPNGSLSRTQSVKSKKALLDYKAKAFRHEQTLSSFGYEVKASRATWDPNLADGAGGWRCPVGTRYGGRITDRFARNCGWGVTRRIANAIVDTGKRTNETLRGRRNRGRRNEIVPKRGRRGAARSMDRLADRVEGSWGRSARAERRVGRVGQRVNKPNASERQNGIPERMDRAAREVLEGTFLENRRRRRGSARNRPQVDERIDNPSIPKNRRQQRREAVVEQARTKPQVAVGERLRLTEQTPLIASRTSRVSLANEPESKLSLTKKQKNEVDREISDEISSIQSELSRSDDPFKDLEEIISEYERDGRFSKRISENEDRPLKERQQALARSLAIEGILDYLKSQRSSSNNSRFKQELPQGQSPSILHIAGADEQVKAQKLLDSRIEDELSAQRKEIQKRQDEQGYIARRISALETLADSYDEKSRDANRSMDDRFEFSMLANITNRQLADFYDLRRRRAEDRMATGDFPYELTQDQLQAIYRRQGWAWNDIDDIRTRIMEGSATVDYLRSQRDMYADFAREGKRIAFNSNEDEFARIHGRIEQLTYEGVVERLDDLINDFDTRRIPISRRGQYSDEFRPWLQVVPNASHFLDDDEREEFVNSVERAKAAGKRQAEAELVGIEDDPVKIRELAAKASQKALAEERKASTPPSSFTRDAESYQPRIESAIKLAGHQAELEVYKNALERHYAINGEDTPSPERVQELGEAAKDEFYDAFNRRSKRVGDYMTKRYGNGPAPWLSRDRMRADEILDLWNDPSGDGRDEVRDWIRNIYEIDDIETPNGMVFQTEVDEISSGYYGDDIFVSGRILALNPNPTANDGSDDYVLVGSFSRRVKPDDQAVEHATLFLTPEMAPESIKEKVKNSGFATIFNGHAITWLKGAGFDRSEVSAASDGPYVWPRLGFVEEDTFMHEELRKEIRNQLLRYRSGDSSIIANERDAAKIQYLLDRNQGTHTDFILALSNRDDEDGVVKNWFTSTPAAFHHGELSYSDWAFPDDPRNL